MLNAWAAAANVRRPVATHGRDDWGVTSFVDHAEVLDAKASSLEARTAAALCVLRGALRAHLRMTRQAIVPSLTRTTA